MLIFAPVSTAVADEKPKTGPSKKRMVGILIFNGVEALDFCGPYEVFSFAAASPEAFQRGEGLFDVRIVAATTETVTARGGLKVAPTDSFQSCPQVDILVVPGGSGQTAALKNKALLDWVARQAGKAELATSVCTGSFILAEAGLLDGKRSATHQMAVKDMQAKYPKVKVVAGRRVVEDGNAVTAAGVSSGLDMSLRVVGRLHGDEVARLVAHVLEYPYPSK